MSHNKSQYKLFLSFVLFLTAKCSEASEQYGKLITEGKICTVLEVDDVKGEYTDIGTDVDLPIVSHYAKGLKIPYPHTLRIEVPVGDVVALDAFAAMAVDHNGDPTGRFHSCISSDEGNNDHFVFGGKCKISTDDVSNTFMGYQDPLQLLDSSTAFDNSIEFYWTWLNDEPVPRLIQFRFIGIQKSVNDTSPAKYYGVLSSPVIKTTDLFRQTRPITTNELNYLSCFKATVLKPSSSEYFIPAGGFKPQQQIPLNKDYLKIIQDNIDEFNVTNNINVITSTTEEITTEEALTKENVATTKSEKKHKKAHHLSEFNIDDISKKINNMKKTHDNRRKSKKHHKTRKTDTSETIWTSTSEPAIEMPADTNGVKIEGESEKNELDYFSPAKETELSGESLLEDILLSLKENERESPQIANEEKSMPLKENRKEYPKNLKEEKSRPLKENRNKFPKNSDDDSFMTNQDEYDSYEGSLQPPMRHRNKNAPNFNEDSWQPSEENRHTGNQNLWESKPRLPWFANPNRYPDDISFEPAIRNKFKLKKSRGNALWHSNPNELTHDLKEKVIVSTHSPGNLTSNSDEDNQRNSRQTDNNRKLQQPKNVKPIIAGKAVPVLPDGYEFDDTHNDEHKKKEKDKEAHISEHTMFHAISMLFIWFVCVPNAIFISRYFKDSPNGKKCCGKSLPLMVHILLISVAFILLATSVTLAFQDFLEKGNFNFSGHKELEMHIYMGIASAVLFGSLGLLGLLTCRQGSVMHCVNATVHFLVGNASYIIALTLIWRSHYLGMPCSTWIISLLWVLWTLSANVAMCSHFYWHDREMGLKNYFRAFIPLPILGNDRAANMPDFHVKERILWWHFGGSWIAFTFIAMMYIIKDTACANCQFEFVLGCMPEDGTNNFQPET